MWPHAQHFFEIFLCLHNEQMRHQSWAGLRRQAASAVHPGASGLAAGQLQDSTVCRVQGPLEAFLGIWPKMNHFGWR